MKKQPKKVLALALSAVMALSTFIYVGAADGADAAAETAEEAVVETAVSDTAIVTYSDTEEATNADLLNSSYAEGEEIDYGLTGITVYAATALTLGNDSTGDYLRSSLSNVAYADTSGNTISTRLLFKVTPTVTGDITVTSGATGKTGYVLEETDTEGVFEVTSTTDSADTIIGFLTAGKTYYIAYSGTNPKVYSFAYVEGSEAATTTEGTTETTTEAYTVDLTDINDVDRATPGTATDGSSHTLWIVGDSTGCYYNETSRIINRNGFGMALGDDAANCYTAEYKIFDNENLEVRNLAVSGRSSLDYLTDSYYTTLTSGWKEGDYLIIAFGHNDEKNTDTARFTDASLGAEGWNTSNQFAYSLYANYILPAVQAGVTPILATPIIRRSTSASGPSGSNVHDCTSSGIGDYRQTIIDLGTKFGLSVIDNTYNTYMECITLGTGDCTISDDKTSCELTGYAAYHSVQSTGIDNTHVGPSGARMIAYFMGQTIKGNDIEFGVTGDGSSTITPILTDCSADNGSVFTSLATFFGTDADADPRTGEYNDTTEEDDSFKIYMNYDGDASKLYAGDAFNIDVCAANVTESGIGSVTITFTYNTEEVTIGSGDLTDSAGNVIITASDFAAAVAAQTTSGVYNTITLTSNFSTAVTADETLFSIPFTLNKRGEVAITTDSVSVADASGTAYTDVSTPEFVINADSDITDGDDETDGLVITPKLTANEDGTYTLDYVLSGNTSELGISAMTLYVDYDPSVVMVTGANDTAEVGSVDSADAILEYLMPYATVTQQIALVPDAGDADYADAAAGPAGGTKTAAQLGRIRLANYLTDADSDGKNDSAYNNGVIFSLVLTAVSAASADEVAAAVSTGTPSAGAFGNADGEEITVTIEGNTSGSSEETGLRGDVDNNGIITANDAACLLTYVLNNDNLNSSWVVTDYVANVNGDETIDAADVAEIMSKVLNSTYVFSADAAA
ncbi:MAG: hypothetical protein LUD77_08580 [Clostridiales bacterium]|nr:hypothetical protein [Clostridiales bacterium]